MKCIPSPLFLSQVKFVNTSIAWGVFACQITLDFYRTLTIEFERNIRAMGFLKKNVVRPGPGW